MPRSRRNLNKSRLGSRQSYTSSETPTEEQILLNEALEETVHSGDQLHHNETIEDTVQSENYENSEQEQSSSLRKKARTAWEVNVMNEEGILKKKKMKTIEIWSLPSRERVIVPFDEYGVPTSDASALLTGVLAELAQLTSSFPINYSDWRHVPEQYKEDVFSKTIMPKFHFENEAEAKKWIFKNIGKKWKDFKSKLWDEFYDPSLSRVELISNCPTGIHRDQWSSFVEFRLSKKSMDMCRKNAKSRKCQTIPHTCGSKSFARRRAEMEIELGRKVGRTEVWLDTHKKKDGTYVNEAAKNISEKIIREMGQSSNSDSQFISHEDALGKVFGKEHPGRVRALGFGPCPSTVFKGTSRVNVANDCQMRDYVASLEKELAATKSKLEAQNHKVEAQNLQMEDMKKTLGGALVTVFENALGKVPEQFANWLNQTFEVAPPDEGSGHQLSVGSKKQYSSSSHDVNDHSPS